MIIALNKIKTNIDHGYTLESKTFFKAGISIDTHCRPTVSNIEDAKKLIDWTVYLHEHFLQEANLVIMHNGKNLNIIIYFLFNIVCLSFIGNIGKGTLLPLFSPFL